MDNLTVLDSMDPAVTATLRSYAMASVLDTEAQNPTANGDEKHELARVLLEQRIRTLYEGLNKYVYDVPPLADLLVENLVIPYLPTAIYWAWEQLDSVGVFGHKVKEQSNEAH